jgi:hypothetical protein
MANRILIALLFVFFFTGLYAQQKRVVIRISQDDAELMGDFQQGIKLKKKPFKFQVLLENVEGVYVFASYRDSVYRFTEDGPIRDFKYLPLLQIPEEEYNANKELNLSETGWGYWFYKSEDHWHPFARKVVKLDTNSYVCTKHIKQFHDLAEEKTIRIRDMKSPLYLFFIAVDTYDENGTPVRELMRRKVKIDWANED